MAKEPEAAACTMKKEALNGVSKLQEALNKKDTAIVALKLGMHDTIRAEVNTVVKKMEVRILSH
jgi:hypothetical protein